MRVPAVIASSSTGQTLGLKSQPPRGISSKREMLSLHFSSKASVVELAKVSFSCSLAAVLTKGYFGRS